MHDSTEIAYISEMIDQLRMAGAGSQALEKINCMLKKYHENGAPGGESYSYLVGYIEQTLENEFNKTKVRRVAVTQGNLKRAMKLAQLLAASGEARNHKDSSFSKNAEKIMYFVLPKHQRESILGDLEEEYNTIILPKFGLRTARLWYWKQAIGSVWPVLACRFKRMAIIAWMGKFAEWVYQRLGT